ncbi:MAG: peptidoglycan-binding domain-containing protein [Polyangiaceae bacterium]
MGYTYVIRSGDCLTSVAHEHGYFPGTIWQHPLNEELRDLRGDPNVLLPGDRLFLPDKDPKTSTIETGKRHRFVRRGIPARFRLQILNADKPRPGLTYKLTIDGSLVLEGKTDGAGVLDVPIPPGAHSGELYIEEDNATHTVRFAQLHPVSEDSGVRQRLKNLGYLRTASPSEDDLAAAVKMLQRRHGLEPTGALDEATAAALYSGHDHKT